VKKKKVTKAEVIRLLKEVIAEAPRGAATVYHRDISAGGEWGCVYGNGPTEPMCIVGHVIVKSGRTLPYSETYRAVPNGTAEGWLQRHYPGEFTPAAIAALATAQAYQDSREPWGVALKQALRSRATLAGRR
jgi:hypothetical protein